MININRPLVSIICATYNQEKYIAKAIDGFMRQSIVSDCEILVHDDASTDKTVRIVKSFKSVSNKNIRLIEETNNQYSKGINITALLCNEAHGKYIAICEGDDFWIDENKLEKQVSYMEANPECSFCFSNAKLYDNMRDSMSNDMLPRNDSDAEILTRGDFLQTGDMLQISFIPTASFFFRKADFDRRPIFNQNAYVGDRYIQIVLTELGYAHYIPECMVAYRINNKSSMMGQWSSDVSKRTSILKKYCEMYLQLDKWTNEKYHSIIQKLIEEEEYALYSTLIDYKKLKNKKYREIAKRKGFGNLLKYYLRCYAPFLCNAFQRIK